jgi:threonine/homoserine/homoserine lactone efflux protein
MENLMSTILSNHVYMIIAGIAVVIIIFLLLKKLFKLVLWACAIFIVFLAYVHYTGGSVKEALIEAKDKGEQIIE